MYTWRKSTPGLHCKLDESWLGIWRPQSTAGIGTTAGVGMGKVTLGIASQNGVCMDGELMNGLALYLTVELSSCEIRLCGFE